MDKLNLIKILDRETIKNQIIDFLNVFNSNKHDLSILRGIYLYGAPGIGKTEFIKEILNTINVDMVYYDASDIRNKNVINNITNHNMSDTNILSMFHKKVKKIVIVMDEVDGMNNGDKGGINNLIKIIRPKKTKKQKKEDYTINPIICISNYNLDKKIKELKKNCLSIELKSPTYSQLENIVNLIMPNLQVNLKQNILKYVNGDLRKLVTTYDIYNNQQSILKNQLVQNIFKTKTFNDDTKDITKKLINQRYHIDEHNTLLNDTDRTSVALLFHENIIDILQKCDKKEAIQLYLLFLNNICFADYIDRITFQKQIWIFNEMSSLLKTFKNNKLIHDEIQNIKYNPLDVRFTKVLTKYSTEYNNNIFIQMLCQQLTMDKKDLYYFFLKIKEEFVLQDIYEYMDNYDINKLDVNRMYRLLE